MLYFGIIKGQQYIYRPTTLILLFGVLHCQDYTYHQSYSLGCYIINSIHISNHYKFWVFHYQHYTYHQSSSCLIIVLSDYLYSKVI